MFALGVNECMGVNTWFIFILHDIKCFVMVLHFAKMKVYPCLIYIVILPLLQKENTKISNLYYIMATLSFREREREREERERERDK